MIKMAPIHSDMSILTGIAENIHEPAIQISGQYYKVFLGFGTLFGLIAGLMAFTISYGEYVKHYPTKDYPIKLALLSALVTFLFFLALSFILSFFTF